MKAQHIKSEYTGSREGNPDSRVRGSHLWRRPSTELEPVATFSGSVRSDRCNKSRSPRANAPSATRASKTSLPNVHSMDDKGTPPNPTCFRKGNTNPPSMRPGSTYPPSSRRGSTYPPSSRPGSTYPPSSRRGSTCPPSVRPGNTCPPSMRPGSTYPPSSRPGSTYPSFFRMGSTYPPSFRRGLGGGHRCQAKGRVSGREFGRRRTLVANGSRLRHEDVQNYPMGSGRAQTPGRNPGPRSGNVGSDRTREASSPTSRTKRQRLMDWHLTRKVPIPFNGKNKTTAPNH